MIGDTIHDKNGAEKAGIAFIGVSYGFGLKDVTDACFMAKNVKELGMDSLETYEQMHKDTFYLSRQYLP